MKAQFFKKDSALKNLRYAIDRYGESTATLIKRYSECEKTLTGKGIPKVSTLVLGVQTTTFDKFLYFGHLDHLS